MATDGSLIADFDFDPRLASAATLPSRCYNDSRFLDAEREKVFARTWQLVGREDQVSTPGRFFTAEVAGEPLLITRGADSRLRALSNVCRHRAGPVAAGEGTCQAFRCGYHGWSYALDGRLLNTPELDGVENFRKEEHALPEFRIEIWMGLLFVNLDDNAPALAEALEDLPARLASRRLEAMKPAARKDWTVECNWKVYVDNYLEGYHIPIVHPSLMKELDYARYVTETSRCYSLQRSPIRESGLGRLKRIGSEDEALYFWIYPNLMLNVYPDNFSTNLILPLGHERTLTVFEWFFRDPDKPETREAVGRTVEFSDEIQLQDIAICEAVQKGLKSRTYDRGRYSVRRENGVHHFHSLLARALRED
ncbi:MAG TPA: SRPBCC family protein [Thermoanaerobaculia bacterium]|nr:SRPBCC family protein [Thermoanaerobaculia bacterium]